MLCPFCKEEIDEGSTVCELCESSLVTLPDAISDGAPSQSFQRFDPQQQQESFVAQHTLLLASCFGGCIALVHLFIFKFVPLPLHLFYIPIMTYIGYMAYMKYFRSEVWCRSKSISRAVWWSGLATMLTAQYMFVYTVALGTVSCIISLMAMGIPVPFLGTLFNYRNRQEGIEMTEDMLLFFNALPALEGFAILLLVSIAITLTKTLWELEQEGQADPVAQATGMASAVNIGLSQLTMGIRGKQGFDAARVEDATLREKLKTYTTVDPSEHCTACNYTGPMGVVGTRVPWYLSWWLLIPVACTGIGFVWVAIAIVLRFWNQIVVVECPMCGVTIEASKN